MEGLSAMGVMGSFFLEVIKSQTLVSFQRVVYDSRTSKKPGENASSFSCCQEIILEKLQESPIMQMKHTFLWLIICCLSPCVTRATPTTAVSISANLDSRSAYYTSPPTSTWPALSTSANLKTLLTVYDYLCNPHQVVLYFFKGTAANNTWAIGVYLDGGQLAGGTADTPVGSMSAPIVFNEQGVRISVPPTDVVINANWANGAGPSSIGFSFPALTQYAMASGVSSITQEGGNCSEASGSASELDFDGDGKDDYAFWKPSNGQWAIITSSSGYQQTISRKFGKAGDIPMSGDFSGDGKADIVIFRPSNGNWYICKSDTDFDCTQSTMEKFGGSKYKPMRADHDGDGKRDLAVFNTSTRKFVFKQSSDGNVVSTAKFGSAWTPLGLK